MTEADILKWAVGTPINLPRFEGNADERILHLLGVDEARLLSLLQYHRLAHRFLHRFQQERPGWCSKMLLGRVLELCHQAEAHTLRQMALLRQINAALDSPNHPVLPVKGFTTYALTAQSRNLRLSGDMDLFSADLDRLWETLQRLGYTGEKLPQEVHEFSKMARADILIELHCYFPVFTYPQGLAAADTTPAHHPGIWTQTFPELLETKVLYEDLLAHTTCGLSPDT